jgi:hypothetical protein
MFEKDGMFHSHLTYSEKGWQKPEHEPITTMTKEEMMRFLRNEGVESISIVLEKYGETDEALVMTNEGKKIFRELLKGSINVNVRGRSILFDFQFGHLINKEEMLCRKADQLFKIGTVTEALENNLFGEKFILSPELKPILKIGNEIYIHKRSPLEILEFLEPSKSIEEVFKKLDNTELRLISKYAEILGVRRLFIELERRNLLEKWFPQHI